MKINEKTLLHIAQSAENPIDQCGWLYKLNSDKKDFQKRWCVLKENILFYYEYKNSKEPLGAIILEGYRVEIVEDVERYFAFKIDFGKSQFGLDVRSYFFASDSHDDMERWVKALSCASYDYLKTAVSELQHRLDELKILKLRKPISSKEIPGNDHNNSVRFNPFDKHEHTHNTFIDLHEEYGRQLRKYFKNPNQADDTESKIEQQT